MRFNFSVQFKPKYLNTLYTHPREHSLDVVITNVDEAITNISIHVTDDLPIKFDHHLVTFELQ